jgi:hypothetical protein
MERVNFGYGTQEKKLPDRVNVDQRSHVDSGNRPWKRAWRLPGGYWLVEICREVAHLCFCGRQRRRRKLTRDRSANLLGATDQLRYKLLSVRLPIGVASLSVDMWSLLLISLDSDFVFECRDIEIRQIVTCA